MKVVVLIDGLHTRLSRLVAFDAVEMLVVYVAVTGPGEGLELMHHRPGRGPLPPHARHAIVEAQGERSEAALAEAQRLAEGLGARATKVHVEGEAGRAVCELAAKERADLVVVRAGGPDRPPVGPKSLGPVARFITDHSPCPVLLLR